MLSEHLSYNKITTQMETLHTVIRSNLFLGCGEGKYLQTGTQSWMIGTDRSSSLSEKCSSKGNEVATCDITKMPFRDNLFDGIICISVVHHLATETRRIVALKELGRMLKPGGKVLITAWALENEYRKVTSVLVHYFRLLILTFPVFSSSIA